MKTALNNAHKILSNIHDELLYGRVMADMASAKMGLAEQLLESVKVEIEYRTVVHGETSFINESDSSLIVECDQLLVKIREQLEEKE